MDRKLLIVSIGFAASIFVSALLSRMTYNTDFPAFYSAASTILDPDASPQDVYREDLDKRYPVPERKEVKTLYIYSLPVAFLLAPLAWMPYYTAKGVMIFANIVSYLSAVAIILAREGIPRRRIGWGMGLSCLWLPFIATLLHAQVNAIILLLVALAVFSVNRGHPYLCGILLALAALFKLFPLAIGFVLGIRNWRIFAGFTVLFAASFLLPGSSLWISTVWNLGKAEAPFYVWLKTIHPVLAYIFPVLIGSITAMATFMARDDDFPLLAAFAIPAVFLAMPMLGYFHLTLLVFTYGTIFSLKEFRNAFLLGLFILSALVIGFPRPGPVSPFVFDPVTPLMYLMLFSLWVVLGIRIAFQGFPIPSVSKV